MAKARWLKKKAKIIKIGEDTLLMLKGMKKPGESYDEVIKRLLEKFTIETF